MSPDADRPFASRAGEKLAHALRAFRIDPAGRIAADLGSNTGGFVDCLLRAGAMKVYAVERGYGVLDYRLRQDPRVIVMERTDALQLRLPETVDLVSIDVGWTRQRLILPVAATLLGPHGEIISLIKPHYEAPPERLRAGVLPDDELEAILAPLRADLPSLHLRLIAEIQSPLRGHGGNREMLWHLRRMEDAIYRGSRIIG